MWITLNVALSNLASHGRNSGNVYTGALWRLVSKRFQGWLIGRRVMIKRYSMSGFRPD